MRLPDNSRLVPYHRPVRYRLDCGREVHLRGFYVSPSAIEWQCGGIETIRDHIIDQLPERARKKFPPARNVHVKPVPEGELPFYAFMVHLMCFQQLPAFDGNASSLAVCWLADDIEKDVLELIDHGISDIQWDKYAEDAGDWF